MTMTEWGSCWENSSKANRVNSMIEGESLQTCEKKEVNAANQISNERLHLCPVVAYAFQDLIRSQLEIMQRNELTLRHTAVPRLRVSIVNRPYLEAFNLRFIRGTSFSVRTWLTVLSKYFHSWAMSCTQKYIQTTNTCEDKRTTLGR